MNGSKDLRRKAEALARENASKAPEHLAALSIQEIQGTLHELRVHQIELEMQNEELRAAQAELEESRERYLDLYDLAPVGYCTLSEQGLIREANLTVATLPGTARNRLIKQPISSFILREDQDIFYRHRKQLFEAGDPQTCELRLVKPDRAIFWAHLAAIAALDSSGAPVCRVALTDITERKRAEEELRKVCEKTELFAYSVSHDLKSPSVAIYGLTKRLQESYAKLLGEKGGAYCAQILKAAEHISALVRQINVYISAGNADLAIERVDLKDAVQIVREEVSEQLGDRQIKWSEPDRLPEIRADRIAVLRILRNLVDNALKYGGDLFTELRMDYKETDVFHLLSVSNNGAMIREGHVGEIFRPFRRYDTDRRVGGAGLGLAIVMELDEQHGGKAWVESAKEPWTTFHVSISKNL